MRRRGIRLDVAVEVHAAVFARGERLDMPIGPVQTFRLVFPRE